MALAKINLTVKSTVKNEDDPTPELISENASGYMKYTVEEGVVHLAYKTATESGAVETRIEIYGRDVRLILIRFDSMPFIRKSIVKLSLGKRLSVDLTFALYNEI